MTLAASPLAGSACGPVTALRIVIVVTVLAAWEALAALGPALPRRRAFARRDRRAL